MVPRPHLALCFLPECPGAGLEAELTRAGSAASHPHSATQLRAGGAPDWSRWAGPSTAPGHLL